MIERVLRALGTRPMHPRGWSDELRWAVKRGALVLEEIPNMRASVGTKSTQGTVALPPNKPAPSTPKEPADDHDSPTWFEVRLVDELGEPIGGAPLVLEVGGKDHALSTDGDGRIRLDGTHPSFGQVRMTDLEPLRDLLRPRWDQVRSDDWLEPAPDHTFVAVRGSAPIARAVLSETPHTLVVQPWAIRARLIGMYFDTNKSFLLPTAMASVRKIKTLYDQYPESAVLVVGHTDASGDPSYNDPLSLERAEATSAFLQDDVDGWLAWYETGVAFEKRWGGREDGLMLSALPDAASLMASANPIAAFQASRGLEVDGWAGPQTRRQLITEYMAQDDTTLPDAATITAHGCGESFPVDEAELTTLMQALEVDDDQLQRRVEIYFFDRELGVQPPPPGSVSPPGSTAYPEWVRRALETHDFSLSGMLRLRVFDHFAVPMAGVDYMIEVDDRVIEGKTDATGCIVVKGKLPAAATCIVRYNRLSVGHDQTDPALAFEFEREVHLDADHRVDAEAARTRLVNLGYEREAKLEDCVRHFQFHHDLPTTGEPNDPVTMAKLVERHHAMAPEKREHEVSLVGASSHE